jgi:PAS domain S-box-containing protein
MIKNSKILIVDDEPRLCNSLKTLLCTQNYDVKMCSSGNEALTFLTQNEFDLVLLDIFMEGMDGFHVIENIMNQKIDTPVIIMTGNASTESAVKAYRMGANDYLKNPFETEELFSTVKKTLNLRKLKKENELMTRKLNESTQRFRNLTESTSDWIWEVDLKGMYIYSSPKVKELLGYEPEELIGKTPFDLMPVDEAKQVSDLFNIALSSQSPFDSIEKVNIHKNGSHVVMETSGVPIFNNEGELFGYRGIDRDITDRKQIEEELRNSELKHKALVKNIPGMVYRAYPDWSAEVISGSEFLCGYTEKELNTKNKNWLSIIHHDDIESVFENGSELTRIQKNLVQRYRIHTKEGDIRWVEDRKTSVLSEKGDFLGIDGIVFDITNSKRAEEGRERILKELQEALENVKILSGLLPICSQCKKIRDDKGYWNQLEAHIQKHSYAKFSHGICPECSDGLYGDEDWYIEMKKEKKKKE